MFNGRKVNGEMRREAEVSVYGALYANFAVIFDSVKVIFKLSPDDDQTIFEFILEKLGALALLVVSFIVLAVLMGVLYLMI